MKSEPNPLRRLVLKESFWTLVMTVISRFGGLIFTSILARYLLPEGFGLYSLALSIAIVFITCADVGINQTLLRFVSSSIDKNEKKAAAYYSYLLRVKLRVTFFSAIALALTAYPLAHFLFKKPDIFSSLIVLSAYVFIAAMQGFYESLFYSKSTVKELARKETLFQLARICLLFLFFSFFIGRHAVLGATLALLAATLVSFSFVMLRYKKIFHFKPVSEDIDKKRILAFIGFLTLSSIAGVLFSYMDTLIMGIYLSAEYLGQYKAAINIIIAIAGALSFPGVFLSTLSKIKENDIQKSFDKIMSYLMILVIPAMIGTITLARYFIVLLYSYDYLTATPLVYILAPLIFFFVTTSIFLSLLAAREKIKDFSIITVICTILNAVLIVAFIKYFMPSQLNATIGAAFATLISWVIYFLAGLVILRYRTNITFHFRALIKPLVASLVMGATLTLFQYLSPNMNLIKGIASVVAGAVIYFLTLYLIKGLTKEDILFIKKILVRK